MPIYEYLCESCGKVNERLQKFGDPPPPRCDECGSRKLAKLVSRSAFQLKGGGWYSDLYGTPRKDGKAADAGAEAPASKGEATAAPASDAGKDAGKDAPKDAAKEPSATPARKPADPAQAGGKKRSRKTG
jgi:putative FmdB family regulatory protein